MLTLDNKTLQTFRTGQFVLASHIVTLELDNSMQTKMCRREMKLRGHGLALEIAASPCWHKKRLWLIERSRDEPSHESQPRMEASENTGMEETRIGSGQCRQQKEGGRG